MMEKFFVIIIFVFAGSLCAQKNKIPLTVYSPIENSSIFIDDNFAGSDSAKLFLEGGSYSLLIKENSRGWNAVRFRDSIYLQDASSPVVIDYGAIHPMELVSSAEVFSLMNAGLEKDKSLSSLRNFRNFGSTYEYNAPVKLNFETSKEKRFIETLTFKLLISSAIALGAASAYFKIKADGKYDKYQRNFDRSYLDETEKYDLYSGIAFGALQINFGALLYNFLKARN